MPDSSRPPSLTAIARPSGALAMVAMDQRDSLTTMFAHAGVQAGPADLVEFKLAVARALGPLASGFLIDHTYGFDRVRAERLLPDGTGLILAADALDQQPGGPVDDTDLDAVVLADDFDLTGVSAIKLLLIWRDDERRTARVELARRFTAAAAERGLLSVLEPVVQPARGQEADFDREQAIRTAARELSVVGQSLYKVQVPLFGKADGDDLDRACVALNDCISGPWVVLSQGVAAADFADAVAAACRAGASGFLAGRALWADVVGRADLADALQQVSVPRLQKLITIVDELATPWDAR